MKTQDRRIRYFFRDGSLCIWNNRYGAANAHIKIRAWPDPAAFSQYNIWNPWQPYEPTERIVLPPPRKPRKAPEPDGCREQLELTISLSGSQPVPPRHPRSPRVWKREAFRSLRRSLPRDLAVAVTGFQSHQWGPIVMVHHCGTPALELLQSSPVLGYILSNVPGFVRMMVNPERKAEAVRTVSLKQKAILGCLKYPSEPRVIKLLRRIHPASLSPELFKPLRTALDQPGNLDRLAHLPSINRSILEILFRGDLWELAGPALLESISSIPRERHYPFAARLLADVVRMHGEMNPERPVPRYREMDRYQAYYDRLAVNYVRDYGGKLVCLKFPPPPVAGTDNIQPILKASDLLEEGRVQRHCVGSHAMGVATGHEFVYRVHAPERATVSIARHPGGGFRIVELKLQNNVEPSRETVQAVQDWLDNARYAEKDPSAACHVCHKSI